MVLRSARGERVVAAGDYFVGPAIDITRMTVIQPGEILTSIRIPGTWAGAQFYFEKVRDRQAWDFPLVNVASALKGSPQRIEAARVVVGAVAATPKRLANVEQAIVGKPRNEETADMAGKLAVEGAVALRYNGYKLPLMRNLVKRAIRGSEGGAWTS
jgi:xanthine dehydrogenase YagS FAD-binding subunit